MRARPSRRGRRYSTSTMPTPVMARTAAARCPSVVTRATSSASASATYIASYAAKFWQRGEARQLHAQILGERRAGLRRARLEGPMDLLGDLADLNKLAHRISMLACGLHTYPRRIRRRRRPRGTPPREVRARAPGAAAS